MKAVIAVVILAACGHAAPAPVRAIANVAPADAMSTAAAADETDAGDDESCNRGDRQPMRAEGGDGTVSLESCEPAAGAEDEHATGTAHADLVFERDGARIVETVNEWEYPDYDGEAATSSLVGVLGAPGRDQAALIEHTSSSYDGNGDHLATRAVLQVMAVQGGAWVKVQELEGSAIQIRLANDGSAQLDVDGDARTLRWDGTAITP